MALFFFDMRVGAELLAGKDGLELPNLKAVQIEAARSLGELAQYALWTTAETILGHRVRVEVQDGTGPLRKARQAETGSHVSAWLRSPGLRSPT